MIYDDYAAYTIQYKKEYGDKTVVLIEVGSFWELYDCNERLGADMNDICNILNIQLSRKNKNIQDVSRTNPLMAGFPSHALQRFLPILIDNNYTVVLVGQVTPPPNPTRAVTQIYSKGTVLDDTQCYKNNYNMCIYIEDVSDQNHNIGISLIDVTTGQVFVYECYSDKFHVFDEITRIYLTYKPSEIIFIGGSVLSSKLIMTQSKIPEAKVKVYDFIRVYDHEVLKPDYQNALLKRSYDFKSFLTPIECIDCEKRPLCIISFTFLLKFLFNHNKLIIEKLQMPEIIQNDNNLILGHNTLEQLDIATLSKYLNRCKTPSGKRLFEKYLYNPICNVNILNHRFHLIQSFINLGISSIKEARLVLQEMYDLDRINRRLVTQKLNPQELMMLSKTLHSMTKLKAYLFENDALHTTANRIQSHITSLFDLQVCSKYNLDDNIDENIFCQGQHKELDDLQSNIQTNSNKISSLAANLASSFNNFFKQEYNDRDGYYFSITQKRYSEIKERLKQSNILQSDPITSSSQGNYIKVTSKYLQNVSSTIVHLKHVFSKLAKEYYQTSLSDCANKHSTSLYEISKTLAEYDTNVTNAINAIEYCYRCPSISEEAQSRFTFKNLRHPIVERLGNENAFIENDITLDHDNQQGILLYGLNAAGKSTLMKAVGICIIMAQAGMFVPCSNAQIALYRHLFSRITKNDDLQRGQSTFMVEMSELRNILKRANQHSLVIGDEICSGTESVSALSIVTASIEHLIKIKSNFIFATHLHDLTKLDSIQDLMNQNKLKCYHLHVEYDPDTKELVYFRKLRQGQGLSTYGVEVCRALNMEDKFINRAIEIRNQIERVSLPSSCVYNKDYYSTHCGICMLRLTDEVHHIQEQAQANEHGFIENIHKNTKSNLVGLCSSCHNKVHSNQITIQGIYSTSTGNQLIFSQKNNSQEAVIKDSVIALRFQDKMPYAKIHEWIHQQYPNLKVSKSKIKQIVKAHMC